MAFAAKKAQILALHEDFAKRFLPLPCDSFGAPYPLDTARALLTQMIARHHQHTLVINPTFFTTSEAARLIGASTSPEALERTLDNSVYDVLCKSETTVYNVSSIHGCSKVAALQPMTNHRTGGNDGGRGVDGGGAEMAQHRVFHRGRWCLAGVGDVARTQTWRLSSSSSSSSLTGDNNSPPSSAEGQAVAVATGTTHQETTPAGNTSPTSHVVSSNSTIGEAQQHNTHTLWFSHPSILNELEELFQSDRRSFSSRMWCSPNSIPKNLAANGNRLTVHYALPRKLISATVVEPRVSLANKNRIMRPFHYWARTGLRVTYDNDEEEETKTTSVATEVQNNPSSSSSGEGERDNKNESNNSGNTITTNTTATTATTTTTTTTTTSRWINKTAFNHNLPYMAWFSSLDLKLFGYSVKPGEEPLVHFQETRMISCVPLTAPYLSPEALQRLNSMDLPQAPAASRGSASSSSSEDNNTSKNNNNTSRYIRLLRSDFKWTVIPASRIELPRNQDDANAVMEVPLADQHALLTLGVRVPPQRQPIVLTVKIPVTAYNLSQIVPVASEVGMPPPWF